MKRLLALLLLAAGAPAPAVAQKPVLPALEALAAKGNADALYHLGMMYQVGSGVAVDHARALTNFRQAAARGQPLAAYKLGCLHAGQDGVLPADEAQALKWKLVAAEAGYALAQHDVAAIHAARGEGALAVQWMTRAAAQGDLQSLVGMARLHDPRRGLVRDPAAAAAYTAILANRIGAPAAALAELTRARAALAPADRTRAEAIIVAYRAVPTPLTLQARSGARAAAALVAASGDVRPPEPPRP